MRLPGQHSGNSKASKAATNNSERRYIFAARELSRRNLVLNPVVKSTPLRDHSGANREARCRSYRQRALWFFSARLYSDDPDALALLAAIGSDAEPVMTVGGVAI